jgi:hypothetical protein
MRRWNEENIPKDTPIFKNADEERSGKMECVLYSQDSFPQTVIGNTAKLEREHSSQCEIWRRERKHLERQRRARKNTEKEGRKVISSPSFPNHFG